MVIIPAQMKHAMDDEERQVFAVADSPFFRLDPCHYWRNENVAQFTLRIGGKRQDVGRSVLAAIGMIQFAHGIRVCEDHGNIIFRPTHGARRFFRQADDNAFANARRPYGYDAYGHIYGFDGPVDPREKL